MADTTEFTGTQQTPQGTGLIPQAGQFLSNVQKIANQPSVQRSLPAVIAVIVLALGLFVYAERKNCGEKDFGEAKPW